MLARDYFDFGSRLDQEGIMLTYCGYVSEAVLMALGDALKQKMAIDEADANLTKRLFSVFVEQVQNIIRYSMDRISPPPPAPQRLGAGLIMVGRKDGRFFVICANTVDRYRAPPLRERLEQLRGMDKDAIRSFYREKLREPPDKDSQGATIGLIEIARRSSSPIEFDFYDIDESRAYFCLKAFV